MAHDWMEWKRILTVLGVLSLCLIIIPIPVQRDDTKDAETEFQSFIKKFNKSYNENSTQYPTRFHNFQESLKQIKILNSQRTSESSALFGLTVFSDLSQDEFLVHHLQQTLHEHIKHSHSHRTHHQHDHNRVTRQAIGSLPKKVDWRKKKIITAVKNQELCGACWAFSTVETVESMNALHTGVLQELSVQEAIDCAGFGNLGCSGGDMCSLLDWMTATKAGLQLESQYPLHRKTEICHVKIPGAGVHVVNSSCDNLVAVEDRILSLLAFHGPVAVAVNALSWQYYLGGVIHFHCAGEPEKMNHAVQLVGYDLTAPVPYYIARNSWGSAFGNSGYLYIATGSNVCGVANEVVTLDVS